MATFAWSWESLIKLMITCLKRQQNIYFATILEKAKETHTITGLSPLVCHRDGGPSLMPRAPVIVRKTHVSILHEAKGKRLVLTELKVLYLNASLSMLL